MSGGLAIGRLLGIEIRVSIAWAVVVAIVTLIGAEQAGVTAPDLAPALRWVVGVLVAAGFFVSVLAHELAHALVARRRGVPTTVIVLGSMGSFAPLAIQARTPADELAIALAGPALSLGLALPVVAAGYVVGTMAADLGAIAGGLVVVGGLSLVLAVLSLLPALPLDGGRIVRALAWRRTGSPDRATQVTARVGRLLSRAAMGGGVVVALLDHVTEGLVLLSMGWFLSTGARTLERRLAMQQLLRGVPVRDAMEQNVPFVGPHLTIDTFSNRYEGDDAVSALAVVDDDRVVGVVGLQRLRRLGRRRFADTRASDIMASPPQAPVLAPDDELFDALDLVNQAGLDGLAVAEDGHLAGMLTRRSLGLLIRDRIAARSNAPG